MSEKPVASPESVAHRLGELRTKTRKLEKDYKSLLVAMKAQGVSGGSLGQITNGSQKSDPTGNAALSPTRRHLQYKARRVLSSIRDAERGIENAAASASEAFSELPGGAHADEAEEKAAARATWRVHRWTDLPCGCARDDHGYWVVSQTCAEHLPMIPLADRVPFTKIAHSKRRQYGPFRPVAAGPAA